MLRKDLYQKALMASGPGAFQFGCFFARLHSCPWDLAPPLDVSQALSPESNPNSSRRRDFLHVLALELLRLSK